MHGAVAHLQKIDVAGEAAPPPFWQERDAVFALKLRDHDHEKDITVGEYIDRYQEQQ